MANQARNLIWDTMPRGAHTVKVKDSTQLYGGAIVGVADADGLLDNWDNVATKRLAGLLREDVLGDTSATDPPHGKVLEGVRLKGVAVAGTPTQAKLFELVYSQTGNVGDLTMTAATSKAIGILIGFRSASDCDVSLFTPEEFAVSQV